jgi:hypothetical protein
MPSGTKTRCGSSENILGVLGAAVGIDNTDDDRSMRGMAEEGEEADDDEEDDAEEMATDDRDKAPYASIGLGERDVTDASLRTLDDAVSAVTLLATPRDDFAGDAKDDVCTVRRRRFRCG